MVRIYPYSPDIVRAFDRLGICITCSTRDGLRLEWPDDYSEDMTRFFALLVDWRERLKFSPDFGATILVDSYKPRVYVQYHDPIVNALSLRVSRCWIGNEIYAAFTSEDLDACSAIGYLRVKT